jgi:hypothetical protein
MSVSSSSSPPSSQFTSEAAVMAHLASVEAQLATATAQLVKANADGNRVVALLNEEKAKFASASRVGVKVPVIPSFKGEVGFGVDSWLRRIVKHFEFYGIQVFQDDISRIRFAIMYLEGSAMDWWDKILESDKSKIITWELFVEALYSRFRPMQAAMVARVRLAALKQTGTVSAYVNIFQRELTPISDMSTADQIFNFRQGLKSHIGQRVLEKMPKTLHEAMDIAILADAHTSKSGNVNIQQFYQNRNGSSSSSSSSQRSTTSSSNDMDLSNINQDDVVKSPTFHDDPSLSSSSSELDMIREFNRMKVELKKYQTDAAISALGSSSTSSSSSFRTPVSKEEFEYCFKNRLCLKCKKSNHVAKDCRSKYQPLNLNH